MHLVEILLPVTDTEGRPFDAQKYVQVREQLAARFGGITAFTRAPAQGVSHANGAVVRDDIVVFEVMTDTLDPAWGPPIAASSSGTSVRMKSSSGPPASRGSKDPCQELGASCRL
jgi:hypothetical protein